MSEYSNQLAGGAACNYSQLSTYTAPYDMSVMPQGKVSSGVYIVPQFAAISYDSLTSAVPSCSGYSNIDSAYGAGAGNCNTQYTTSLCGGAPASEGYAAPMRRY